MKEEKHLPARHPSFCECGDCTGKGLIKKEETHTLSEAERMQLILRMHNPPHIVTRFPVFSEIGVLEAMREWSIVKNKEAQQSDAVEFAEWKFEQGFQPVMLNDVLHWFMPGKVFSRVTTSELYQIFKSKP